MPGFKPLLLSCGMLLSGTVGLSAMPLHVLHTSPAVQEKNVATEIHYRPFAHRHLDRPYYRENDSRVRRDSDAGPQERPDLYRAFDRERIYTQGGAVRGPGGERKLRPAFRDGRSFTIFGN